MKTITLLSVMILISFSALANVDCKIYSKSPLTSRLEQVLNEKGYQLSQDKDAPFLLKLDQGDVVDPIILIASPSGLKVLKKKIGSLTSVNIQEGETFVDYAYGEVSSRFLRSDDYQPTVKDKNCSFKKALRNLKSSLEDCRY